MDALKSKGVNIERLIPPDNPSSTPVRDTGAVDDFTASINKENAAE